MFDGISTPDIAHGGSVRLKVHLPDVIHGTPITVIEVAHGARDVPSQATSSSYAVAAVHLPVHVMT